MKRLHPVQLRQLLKKRFCRMAWFTAAVNTAIGALFMVPMNGALQDVSKVKTSSALVFHCISTSFWFPFVSLIDTFFDSIMKFGNVLMRICWGLTGLILAVCELWLVHCGVGSHWAMGHQGGEDMQKLFWIFCSKQLIKNEWCQPPDSPCSSPTSWRDVYFSVSVSLCLVSLGFED